jgi:HD superfamily phosphohydrolase
VAKLLVDCINRNHRIFDEEADTKNQQQKKVTAQVGTAVQATLLFPKPVLEARHYDVLEVGAFPRICWAQRFCTGIAALLHDIPHPPMSHALEHEASVLNKHDNVLQNPQLYQYLFGGQSVIAKVLGAFSPQFKQYLIDNQAFLGHQKYVKFGKDEIAEFLTKNSLNENHLLAGLVFEILAFKSGQEHPFDSFTYRMEWDSQVTKPAVFYFSKFFRPFYCDLISNTICADLIDYLLRDALNAGIDKKVDLKFLDRMYVKSITSLGINKGPRVVFDLRDWQRGGLRKDTTSDLLSLLECRYSLMERVYMHRTKLAASAMLGRSYLLVNPERNQLYDLDKFPSDDSLVRFLAWSNTVKSEAAKSLAKKILDRNIYQPLFIIDESSCRSQPPAQLKKEDLVKKFRPRPSTQGKEVEGWESKDGKPGINLWPLPLNVGNVLLLHLRKLRSIGHLSFFA